MAIAICPILPKAATDRRGVTIIELLISIAIFAILTAVLTWNFSRQRQAENVRRAANQLVADLRLVQTKAMTGTTIGESDETPAVPVGGYGLHVNFDISHTSYQLFADRERWTGTVCESFRNERYDRGFNPIPNGCLADGTNDDLLAGPTTELPEGVVIDSIAIDNIAVPISALDIAFQPPKPIPYVGYNDPESGSEVGRTVRIELLHTDTGARRRITIVGASGQISVTTP